MKAFVRSGTRIRSRIDTASLGAIGLLVGLALTGCVAPRSETAVEETRTLKTSTLALMDKATDAYGTHAQEIADQNAKLEAAYTRETARPGNGKTVAMWGLLLHSDPARPASGIYPRFVAQWQTSGTLKPVYIADKKTTVGLGFDRIINLENAKRSP